MADLATPARRPRITPARLLGIPMPPVAHCDLARCDSQDFVKAFRGCAINWELLGPQLRFSERGYYRKRLHRNSAWEVLLLCWLPGQHTVIHDHGSSFSATRILSGEMTEIVYESRGRGRAMRHVTERTLAAGRITVEPIGAVHKVWNGSSLPAASLHLYSPPLRELGSYDEKTGARRSIIPDRGPDEAVGGKPLADA